MVSIAFLSALTGCFDYEEEMWLNKDGSGKVDFKIKLPSEFVDDEEDDWFEEGNIRADLEKFDGIDVEETKTYMDGDQWIIAVKLRFTSWDLLAQVDWGDDDKAKFWGSMTFEKEEDGQWVYQRTVEMSEDEDEDDHGEEGEDEDEDESKLAERILQGIFGGYYWRYTVHFPDRIISANAEEKDIDKKKKTVTWEFELIDLVKEPATMRATIAD